MSVLRSSRREFLAESGRAATAGWVALHLPWLGALASCAREDERTGKDFVELTPAEGRATRAFAAQIIPSDDDGPGAAEAGAVYFVDRALGMPFFAHHAALLRAGLADLDARARKLDDHAEFATLSPSAQVMIMKQIERGAFFATARMLVVIGTFADQSHGGNKDDVGTTLVGIDHRPSYAAPFGWYDAQERASRRASTP